MKKHNIILLLIIMACSFLFIGCTGFGKKDVKIVKGNIAKEALPSYIKLGQYKGVKVKTPKENKITDKDIQEQIDYAVKKAGKKTLTKENVKVVSGYDSIAEYKKAIVKGLKNLNESSKENELMNKAWDAAVDNSTLTKCPEDMLNREVAEVKASYMNYTNMLHMSYGEVLKHFNITEKDIRDKALNYVKSDILVYAIAKAENITVSDTQYQQEVKSKMKLYKVKSEQELSNMIGDKMDLHFVFLADRVMKFVYDHADIQQ